MTERTFAEGFTVTALARAAGLRRKLRAGDLALVTAVLREHGWNIGDRGRWWPPSIRPIVSGANRGETVGEGFALRRARRATCPAET